MTQPQELPRSRYHPDPSLVASGLAPAIVDEVAKRTPGYETWQGESWVCHCDDACAFLGDATKEQLSSFTAEGAEVIESGLWDQSAIDELLKYYEPKGSPSFYRFRCLHCEKALYHVDRD